MQLERIVFPDPYQYKTVEIGEKVIVWDMPVSGGYVAFIDKVSVDWYVDTFTEFIIDGILKEKIQRTILDVDSVRLEPYDPPLIAEKRVRFIVTNNSDADIVPGILCDGYLCKPIS